MSNPRINQNQNQNQNQDQDQDQDQNQNQNRRNVELRVTITPPDEHKILLDSVAEGRQKEPKLLKASAGSSSCSIFRVPQSIVKHHESTFQPELVSIGPYYHDHEKYPHLKMMQEHKWKVLNAALNRQENYNVTYDDFLIAIAHEERNIRECYSETLDYITNLNLLQMMILDGCFIIELFLAAEGIFTISAKANAIFALPWISTSLAKDLLRLENQIPFFVLQKLFDLSIKNLPFNIRPLTVIISRFYNQFSIKRPEAIEGKYSNFSGANHLLDFIRIAYEPSSHLKEETRDAKQKNLLNFIETMFRPCLPKEATNAKDSFKLIQPVEMLRKAGIECKQLEEAESFLDINFKPYGVLEIPTLPADDFMKSFILNCIAFEQCNKHCSQHFTSYVLFMGCLINTALDAGYLRDHSIIENYSGTDEEIVKFFNEVSRSTCFVTEETYLKNVFKHVNEYYRKDLHVKWASFKYKYFDTPWTFMSALAALVLLILTLVQSYISIHDYIKKEK